MNLNQALLKIADEYKIDLYTIAHFEQKKVLFEIRSASGGVLNHTIAYLVKWSEIAGMKVSLAMEFRGESTYLSDMQYARLADYVISQWKAFQNVSIFNVDGGDLGRGKNYFNLNN